MQQTVPNILQFIFIGDGRIIGDSQKRSLRQFALVNPEINVVIIVAVFAGVQKLKPGIFVLPKNSLPGEVALVIPLKIKLKVG